MSKAGLIILRPDDAGALATLSSVAEPLPWSAAAWREQMQQTATLVLALGDPRLGLTGALALCLTRDFADILNLLVHPDFRRQGLASRLLRAGLTHCGERGIARICLDVSVTNHAARTLYTGFGFTEDGRRPRYYPDGEDALLMSRPIAGPTGLPA
ncbi:MAG: GNAT family N-acetyltransferase [Hyphomonadaceae bacterium]|nr:GNAT family N-acetyltransferase [Hyphomonadaceae bacterium]